MFLLVYVKGLSLLKRIRLLVVILDNFSGNVADNLRFIDNNFILVI